MMPLLPLICTWRSVPRSSSLAIRSPSESIAADIAEIRSSSTPAGSEEAMIRPSTLTTADASMSGVPACKSFKRSTIISVRDLIKKLLHAARLGGCLRTVWLFVFLTHTFFCGKKQVGFSAEMFCRSG